MHALKALREAGFELVDYYFGLADFWVQAVVVGQKPLPKAKHHRKEHLQSA